MRKIWIAAAWLALTLGMGGCSLEFADVGPTQSSTSTSESGSSEVQRTYSVIFRQNGQENIQFDDILSGSAFTNIPEPQPKTGYTVAWNAEALQKLACVTENVLVEAIETPNTYTITYDADGGTPSVATQDVVFDSTPTLATATREDYQFMGWTYNDVALTGKWTYAESVTLKAVWVKLTNTYSIIFRQAGEKDVTFENIKEGSKFTNIPEPKAKTGYTVAWNEEDLKKLENVTQNIIVEVVETPKTCKVTLRWKGGSQEATFIYGQAYEIKVTPAYDKDEYTFAGWKRNGAAFASSGIWEIDEEEVVLDAELLPNWTPNF